MASSPQLPAAAESGSGDPVRIYAASTLGAPLRQGELLTGLRVKTLALESVVEGHENLLVDVEHPLVIVASQDCDLEQDDRIRRGDSGKLPTLPSVFLYDVVAADDLKASRPDLNQGSLPWTNAQQNKNERYHFLEIVPPDCDAHGNGLPELAIDFKRYLTVPTDELYARIARGDVQRRCRLESPFLEHWSFRHATFQCRVALPRQHTSE